MGLATKHTSRPSGWLLGLLLTGLPLLGWGQTTIVNYDFGSATGAAFTAAVASPALASGVTATATATGTTTVTVAGVASGAGAFTANAVAGGSITINPFSTGNFFQFQLGGSSLSTYANYKVYFQAQRSNTGPTDITIAYSTNGSTYTTLSPTTTVGTAFGSAEYAYDLSSATALNNQASVFFRVLPSGASAGSVRIDNFQVQASSVPTLNVTPNPLSGFTTTTTSPSTAQSLTVSASNLSPSSGTLTANSTNAAAYEFSPDNVSFTGSLTSLGVPYTSASPASFTIFARLKAGLAAGPYNSQTVTISGGGASTTLTLNGTVTGGLATTPSASPSVSTSGTTATTTTATVSGGDGTKRLLVVRLNSTTRVGPTNGTTYTANGVFGSGSTTGTNNFVVIAGTAGSQLITGLAPATNYVVDVYAYNDNGTSGSEAYLVPGGGTIFNTLAASATPTTYTWNGSAGASFNAPTNWTPARTTPASTDLLIFNGTQTPTANVTLDFTSPQTIRQLQFRNGVQATFTTAANRTLTLDGTTTGDDFTIDATSRLTLLSSTNNVGLTISLTSATTAAISGTLVFNGTSTAAGRHSLISALAGSASANSNAIDFKSGGRLIAGPFFDGSSNNSAFGTTTGTTGSPFSVVFRNGATYEQTGGSNPFALNQPNSLVRFERSSNYLFNSDFGQPATSGRTYGNLTYALPTAGQQATNTGASPLVIQGDLTVTSGTVNLNLTGGVRIGGNVQLNGTSVLNFAPSSPATITLNGTTAQTIGGTSTATINFATNTTFELNNTGPGITLTEPLGLRGTLRLTAGLLNTDQVNILTMLPGATVVAGTTALTVPASTLPLPGFVNGPFEWRVDGVSTPTSFFFPTGNFNPATGVSNYRPLTLNIERQTETTYYRALQQEANPLGVPATFPSFDNPSGLLLNRISLVRYYNFTPYAGPRAESVDQPNNFRGTLKLTFDVNDGVNNPASPELVVAKRADNNAPWFNTGHSADSGPGPGAGNPGVNGFLVSLPFTRFSDFALASTNPLGIINPLPVQLSGLTAAQTQGGVQVRWATASELNSASFDVERSADGRSFTKLTQVAAQGTKTTRSDYAWLDATAPTTALYYRLRQVDQDGTATYSPVVTVAGRAGETAPAEFTLSPNPTRTTVSFATSQPTTYVLRSVLGQALRTGTTTPGLTTLDVADLTAGVYLMELRTDAGRLVRRFVKE